MISARSQRGPKREMSLKQIVDSAIAIADKEGLSAVSMNKVAASLGFTTMALYRYVPSKEDLILLMQDAVLDISIPEENSAHWRENMTAVVLAIMRCFQEQGGIGASRNIRAVSPSVAGHPCGRLFAGERLQGWAFLRFRI